MLPLAGFYRVRFAGWSTVLLLVLVLGALPGSSQAAPPPVAPPVTPDPTQPNLFYGAIPPNGPNGPVIVFVHGLTGTYNDWLDATGNDMYDLAYQAGFRTVFMSLSLDNTSNTADIPTNAAMLQTMFPKILSQFGVTKVYFVCHSKGGLDLQDAIANPQWIGIANAVFTLGTPNQGDALADWLFNTAQGQQLGNTLGLLNPGVQSLETANVLHLRTQWDPIFRNARIPFYTLSGNTFKCANSLTTCLTSITGPILQSLTGGTNAPFNDGLVDHPESLLPTTYAMQLGIIHQNHFRLRLGDTAFPFIFARVMAQENEQPGLPNGQPGFSMRGTGGFGDAHNTWTWSTAWFKGNLYVGTGRETFCVISATAAVKLGIPTLYPPPIGDCTPDYHDLPLQAEIWQYTPQTRVWARVFQSPNSLTTTDTLGNTVATARDIGIRGMTVVKEPDGTQALYAGGVTSGEIFETTPGTWAPPRVLRSVDGVTWNPLPQDPGTFLGDLTQNGTSQFPIYSVRSAAQLNGVLFLQVGDFSGAGRVISTLPKVVQNITNITQTAPMVVSVPSVAQMAACETLTIANATPPTYNGTYTVTAVDSTSNSITLNNTTAPGSPWTSGGTITTVANPACGDNAFQWASPPAEQLSVWILENFNNFMYAGTGAPIRSGPSMYGVYKTDGLGTPDPVNGYTWTPVITSGAYAQGLVADYAMSMRIFADSAGCPGIGCLYVGTDRPNEMVRIHPDAVDSWDLVVGNPRTIPAGQPGAGQLKAPLSGIGQYFNNGFTGHFWNMGVGGQGLYMGTWDWSVQNVLQPAFTPLWSQEFGTDVWRTTDGTHWYMVSKIGLGDGHNVGSRSFAGTPFGLFMGTARDLGGTQVFMMDNSVLDYNHDGVIDQNDVNLLLAQNGVTAGNPNFNPNMDLNQDGVINVLDARLLVTQCTNPGCAVPPTLPPYITLAAPTLYSTPGALGGPVSLSWNAVSGAKDYLVYRIALSPSQTTPPPGQVATACSNPTNSAICSQLPAAQTAASTTAYGFPGPVVLLTRVTTPAYAEASLSTLQSLYFVRTEDANGNLSAPSNIVGGPSLAAQ